MRLTSPPNPRSAREIAQYARSPIAALALACGLLFASSALAAPPPPDPEDILGDLVVEAKKRGERPLRLPKIGVEALASDEATGKLLAIIRRDLDLSFELEVLAEPAPLVAEVGPPAPGSEGAGGTEGAGGESSPSPIAAAPLGRWRKAGAEYVVQVAASLKDEGAAELAVVLYSLRDGDGPVFKKTLVAARGERRLTSHRLSDALIGAITGYSGPFASRLTFVRTRGGERRVQVIDADGVGLQTRSPPERLAVSPTFGPGGALYYAASVDRGRYRLYREGDDAPIPTPVTGSIYGLAFADDQSRIALSIAVDGDIKVFVGPADLSSLEPRSTLPLAMHPAFSPRGTLAFAGTARALQRIYVDGRAVSAKGLSAAAPVFCRHPEGTRLVYSVAVGKREDVITTDERGGDTIRLTAGKGRNSYPACSPDGRLVAFFSDRQSGEGPGLYLMRVDGRRPPKKIAEVTGDSLRWARVP